MRKRTISCLFIIFFSQILKAQYLPYCNYANIILGDPIDCGSGRFYLVYEDNFEGSSLDSKYWKSIDGVVRDPYHGGEQQWYSSNNIVLNDGILKLESRQETLLDQYFSIWTGTQMENFSQDFNYTSGEIDSKYKFGFGIYEIRCKIPKGKGFFPAFWLFTAQPLYDEIDVFEFWNDYTSGDFDADKSVKNHHINYQHDWGGQHHDCPLPNMGVDYSADFHVFKLKWTTTDIEFYVDDVLKRKEYKFLTTLNQPIPCGSIDVGGNYIMNKSFPFFPMQMISNLAIKSNLEGPDNNTLFPNSLEIDYIKYYKQFESCNNQINIMNTSELNLSNEIYNVILGENVYLNEGVVIGPNDQLTVISLHEIVINPNTVIDAGSNFQTEVRENLCLDYEQITANNEKEEKEIIINEKESGHNEALKLKNDIISPNPFNEKIILTPGEYDKIVIKNLQFKNVFYNSDVNKKDNSEIDLSFLESGVYFVCFFNNENLLFSRKIIKL